MAHETSPRARRVAPLAALTLIAAAGSALAQAPPPLVPPIEGGPPPVTPAPAPAPAPADPRPAPTDDAVMVFTFTGRGYGHGVGMSQYGARGRALAGWSAGRILRHYYRGTRLTRVPSTHVRVLLLTSRSRLTLSSPDRWSVTSESAPRRRVRLAAGRGYSAVLEAGRITLRGPGGRAVGRFAGPLRFGAGARGQVRIAAGDGPSAGYRGALRLHAGSSGLDVVNDVNLERYLYGVVPREVPADWADDGAAGVAAQAIAARSYALTSRRDNGIYDLLPDERSQVYSGRDGEDPRTNRAVDATRRIAVTHRGEVIRAFFFSTSGGRTEDVRNVFAPSGPMPYLRSVADPFDRVSPYHRWPDPPSFTAAGLGRRLGLDEPVAGIEVLSRGDSPRVRRALVSGRRGARREFSGAELRAALGLRDTWFTVTRRELAPAAARALVGG